MGVGVRRGYTVLLLAGFVFASVAMVQASSAEASRTTKISFNFGLKRPEARAQAAWKSVTDPGSPVYRQFLTRREIRNRFGASPRTRRALRRFAKRQALGIQIDPTATFVRFTGPVRRLERVFRTKVVRDDSNDPPLYGWIAKGRIRPPASIRALLRGRVPMFNRSMTFGSRNRSGLPDRSGDPNTTSAGATDQPANQGTWGVGCAAARQTGGYSFDQVSKAYGVKPLGDGTNASVAILNAGEGLTPASIKTAADCFGLPGLNSRTLRTDGQIVPFPLGSFEPAMDLALVRGMAPAIGNVTFAQVWESPQFWFLGPSRLFGQASLPDTFSISYGECEADVLGRRAPRFTRPSARLFESAVVRLGLAGVGTYAAAGDSGSTCSNLPRPAVLWPASSAFVTAVGGTRLVVDRANERVDELAWNDLPWLTEADGGGAGGGGFSNFTARPSFQSAIGSRATKRMLPDVAAHASALPGWPANLGDNWSAEAGTSASTPLVAAAMATISASERAAGRPPVGPASPLFYAMGAGDDPPFFDVVKGNSQFTESIRPWYAGPGYDLVTGLGVPLFERIPALLTVP